MIETTRHWAFAAVAVGLALVASFRPLSRTPPPFTGVSSTARPPHRPSPAATDAQIRDPFATGTEWRQRLRERLQPSFVPPPTAVAPSTVQTAPPEVAQGDPPPVLEGTAISKTRKFAVLDRGYFPEGAQVGRYLIVRIELDHVVFRVDGREVVVRVPGRSATGPTRSPTSTGP